MEKSDYLAIGLMSGTSLDGLDIALCRFKKSEDWSFVLEDAVTVEYSSEWKERLASAQFLNGLELAQLNVDLGILHGRWTNSFIRNRRIKPDFIASHGHTVFHQPEKRLTLQIGSAPHIAFETGHTVIADFRTMDVANFGQGAPLVPIGDLLLFPEYAHCLNLGGIANISTKMDGGITAFDICPCNIPLNFFAQKLGKDYDDGGNLARSGSVQEPLLNELNALGFYKQHPPKSLGKEFFDSYFLPACASFPASTEDILRTITEHIAMQLKAILSESSDGKILVTGGGALNDFLLERFAFHTKHALIVPELKIIQFKEALIFAFLGVLRLRGEINCLSSVTGAAKDNIGGAVYVV